MKEETACYARLAERLGFQQEACFRRARFVRLGMIHRNTFINAPRFLDPYLRLRPKPNIRLAGQITGVEGYVESAATGLVAARLLVAELAGFQLTVPPPETALGGLLRHLSGSKKERFQPSNINWGLMARPPSVMSVRGRRERRLLHAEHAVELARDWGASGPSVT